MATSAATGTESVVTLYFDPLSQPCRSVQLFLGLNGIDFDAKEVSLNEGTPEMEQFIKINPLRKVPVIEHKGNVVREGTAILRYLCREFEVDDHWYPENSLRRAKVDEYLEWHHLETRAKSVIYIYSSVYNPPTDEGRIEQCRSKLERSCEMIDKIWLRDSRFIAGPEISLADLVAATELEQLCMTDFDPKYERPMLSAWMSRVRIECSPLYDLVHNYLKDFCIARLKGQGVDYAK